MVDASRRQANERNRRVVLFALGALIAVVGAILADLKLLEQIRMQGVPALADQIVTGLLIASGADPIRELVQERGRRREAAAQPAPLQVTGTLVLQQAPEAASEIPKAPEG